MAKSRKKIETLQVILLSDDDFLFEELLINEDVVEREFKIKGKYVSLRILEKKPKYIIGLVETSRRNNIPPKKDGKKKQIGKLGLTQDEGLAYANVFIYEKERRILMYEVNKNGCYLDHFIEYIYKCCESDDSDYKNFSIEINPVLKTGSYDTVMNMTMHKSFEFRIANPTAVLEAYKHKNDSISQACEQAQKIHSDKAIVKYEVSVKGNAKYETTGLAHQPLKRTVDRLLNLLRTPVGANIEKIEVGGYEQDSDDNRATFIDFVTDRYLKFIELDEPRENSDLLENQRKEKIKTLYNKCGKDFDSIFKVS